MIITRDSTCIAADYGLVSQPALLCGICSQSLMEMREEWSASLDPAEAVISFRAFGCVSRTERQRSFFTA